MRIRSRPFEKSCLQLDKEKFQTWRRWWVRGSGVFEQWIWTVNTETTQDVHRTLIVNPGPYIMFDQSWNFNHTLERKNTSIGSPQQSQRPSLGPVLQLIAGLSLTTLTVVVVMYMYRLSAAARTHQPLSLLLRRRRHTVCRRSIILDVHFCRFVD